MKAKLLKKIRARYTMTFNPNGVEYPYALDFVNIKRNEITRQVYKTKEEMFNGYRSFIIRNCGKIYGCYPKDRSKPSVVVKHGL